MGVSRYATGGVSRRDLHSLAHEPPRSGSSLAEEFSVNAIEFIEVASVFKPDGCLHDILERATSEGEYVSDVLQRLACVSFYPIALANRH